MIQPQVIIHGLRDFVLEPDKLVTRPRGLDQLTRVVQSSRRDAFSNDSRISGYPFMRIKEVETTTEVEGEAYVHRIQAEGLAAGTTKLERSGIRQPEEGWDEGPLEYITADPDRFVVGDLVEGYDSLWIVAKESEAINDAVFRVSLSTKGILAAKARKRRITVNNQPVSSSTTLALDNAMTFKNEAGVFSGWTDQRHTALDASRVVVVDTLLTTSPPPTDKLPGHLTPENAPPVLDIFALSWWSTAGFTFNWPWGWSLKGINSEQLLDKSLWVTTITTEYVPRAVVR